MIADATKSFSPADPSVTAVDSVALLPSPLVTVRGAISFLGSRFNEDDVLAMVEDGRLRWAFNIGGERSRRVDLRIFPSCLQDVARKRDCQITWPEVISILTPKRLSLIRESSIARVLNVSAQLVSLWTKAGDLAVGRSRPNGRGLSRHITIESFRRTLCRRCYPVPMASS